LKSDHASGIPPALIRVDRDDEQDSGILIYRRLIIEIIWSAVFLIFGSCTPDVQKMEEKKHVGLIKAFSYKNKGVFARKLRKPLVESAMPRQW